MVTEMVPPAGVAAIGGLPRMRQPGFTVTWVFGLTPTTVTYERSTIVVLPNVNGMGWPATHPMTR
jgi:hypothetical protein